MRPWATDGGRNGWSVEQWLAPSLDRGDGQPSGLDVGGGVTVWSPMGFLTAGGVSSGSRRLLDEGILIWAGCGGDAWPEKPLRSSHASPTAALVGSVPQHLEQG